MASNTAASSGIFSPLRILRGGMVREVTTMLLFSSLMLQSASAAAPAWWGRQQVLKPGAAADDYAVANVGQLKSIASKAAQEMESSLASSGGAGVSVRARVAEWAAPPLAGVIRDDYALLTIGQLKAVAKPFYDQLAAAGLRAAGSYPWTGTQKDDYALVNLGQLKTVFAFDIPAADPNDTNHNGIPDTWEIRYFGNLTHSGNDDPDGDGISNYDEWQQGTSPTKKDSSAIKLEVHILTSF